MGRAANREHTCTPKVFDELGDDMANDLAELFTERLTAYEAHPNLENTFKMMLMVYIAKKIKREQFSFWLSCTAP